MQKIASDNLREAKKAKKDEFYTRIEDIQNELQHYKAHFKDKIVYCNCDDPLASNFFKYFLLNFKHLDLRGLISTCYKSQNYREVSQEDSPKKAYAIIITKDNEAFKDAGGGGKPYILDDIEKILELELSQKENQDEKTLKNFERNLSKLQEKTFPLKADAKQERTLFDIHEDEGLGNAGDFRSEDCKRLLKKADIVVTNPPFSLFREYVAQLVEEGRSRKKDRELKFLIIGNVNAITYKETFKLIKKNKLWLGVSITSGDRKFYVPDSTPLNAAGCGVEKIIQDGKEVEKKFIRVKGVRWFTNLENKKRNEPLETIASYAKTPEKYPRYDNYDAINVDKTIEIPMDYDGIMGVPITFLDKHNPKQFEIVGIDRYVADNPNYGKRFSINGKEIYARILIRKIAEVEELRKAEQEKMKG